MFKDYLKFVSWKEGYLLLNPTATTATPEFPIEHVWFNDKPQLAKKYGTASAINSPGWLDNLLKYIKSRPTSNGSTIGSLVPDLNDDCPENLAMIGTKSSNIGLFLGPNDDRAKKLYGSGAIDNKTMPVWKMTASIYSQLANNGKLAYPTSLKKWAALENS